jgi:hypothetical protein
VTFKGKPVDPLQGTVLRRCLAEGQPDCGPGKIDVRFPDSASEVDPDNVDESGTVGRETLYVDWFTSVGKFSTNRTIVFDPFAGRPPKTEIDLEFGGEPRSGKAWAILHDNRGGTSWIEVPIRLE